MFNSFEIRKSSRAIKDCVWPSVKKRIERMIKELEDQGRIPEANFAKKRYSNLKAEDVSIEPVREWPGKTNRVCMVSRKAGIAQMDLDIVPLPLDEVLKEFGWDIEVVGSWEEIRALVPTNQPENKLFKVGETGHYASFMAGLLPGDEPTQIHPNSTITNWGEDIFFRQLVTDLSAPAPIENLGMFYQLQVMDTGIVSPAIVYVINTDQTVGTGIFEDVVFPSPNKLPDQDKQYRGKLTRQFAVDLKYLGEGKDFNGLRVRELLLTNKFGQENVHLTYNHELEFETVDGVSTGTFEMEFWTPWPVSDQNKIVPIKIIFEYDDENQIKRSMSVPFHLDMSIPDPDQKRFVFGPTQDRGNGKVGAKVIDKYSGNAVNLSLLDPAVFKSVSFGGRDIPASYNKGRNEIEFTPTAPGFGPVSMVIDPQTAAAITVNGEVNIDWSTLKLVPAKSQVPFTVDGFKFLSAPAFTFEMPGLGVVPSELLTIVDVTANWVETTLPDQDDFPPVFKWGDVLKLNSFYVTPFKGEGFTLKGYMEVAIRPTAGGGIIRRGVNFTVWDGIYTKGFARSEFENQTATMALSGEFLGPQVAEVKMNPPCNVSPTTHVVGEREVFGFTLKGVDPSYEYIAEGVNVGAMFLYDGVESENGGAVISQKHLLVKPPFETNAGGSRFDEVGNKFILEFSQRSVIDDPIPTVRVKRAYTTDGRVFEMNELTAVVSKVEGSIFHISVTPRVPPAPGDFVLINKIDVEYVGPLGVYSNHTII